MPPGVGRASSKEAEALTSAFREKRGGHNDLFASVILKVSLAQNSPYAKVAYFRVASSASLHHLLLYSDVKCNLSFFFLMLFPSKGRWNATYFARISWETDKEGQTQELSCAAGTIRVTASE